jgi:hypothetical protein
MIKINHNGRSFNEWLLDNNISKIQAAADLNRSRNTIYYYTKLERFSTELKDRLEAYTKVDLDTYKSDNRCSFCGKKILASVNEGA